MVDLSRHLQSAKQALDKGQYDLAIAKMEECVEVDPSQLDIYKILLDAARKKAKITGKSMFGGLGMPTLTKDPHRVFIASIKKVGRMPEPKVLVEAADAARVLSGTVKPMVDVAIYFYEEFKSSGLFDDKAYWNLAQVHFDRFKATGSKDLAQLVKAVNAITELDKAMPHHPEAGRTLKNWQATQSMLMRDQAGGGKATAGDYRSQIANDDKARKLEMLSKNIRTPDEAREVLAFLDQDLGKSPEDKVVWIKKGGIHFQFNQFDEARAAYEKAQAIDPHDFNVTMRIGDVAIQVAKRVAAQAKAAGQDTSALDTEALQIEIAEVQRRVERQPTDMNHRFHLGGLFFKQGNIEAAASEYQRTVNDPKLRKLSHRNLGTCFRKKNLLDLAAGQYNSFLRLADDDSAEDAKEVRYLLARIQEETGHKQEAIENYTRLVNIDLAFKDAANRLSQLKS